MKTTNKIKAKIISDTEVELDFGSSMRVATADLGSAKYLLALAEAGLIDVVGEQAIARKTTDGDLQNGETCSVEYRHGNALIIIVRNNQRFLYAGFSR